MIVSFVMGDSLDRFLDEFDEKVIELTPEQKKQLKTIILEEMRLQILHK